MLAVPVRHQQKKTTTVRHLCGHQGLLPPGAGEAMIARHATGTTTWTTAYARFFWIGKLHEDGAASRSWWQWGFPKWYCTSQFLMVALKHNNHNHITRPRSDRWGGPTLLQFIALPPTSDAIFRAFFATDLNIVNTIGFSVKFHVF